MCKRRPGAVTVNMLIGLDRDMTPIDIKLIRSRSEGSLLFKKCFPSLYSDLHTFIVNIWDKKSRKVAHGSD